MREEELTWLDGACDLITGARDVLGEDLSCGLLRLRSDLLSDLLAESLAPGFC
jgi:hypothetical protein